MTRSPFATVGLVLLALTGCRTNSALEVEADGTPTIAQLSNDATYRVSYRTDPSEIPLNEPFSMEVDVREGNGRRGAASDISLQVHADMPAHRHGMIQEPEVRKLGGGRFAIDGMLFHMAGHWEMYVDVTHEGITERTQFDVNLE